MEPNSCSSPERMSDADLKEQLWQAFVLVRLAGGFGNLQVSVRNGVIDQIDVRATVRPVQAAPALDAAQG